MAEERILIEQDFRTHGAAEASKALQDIASGYRNVSREMYRYTFYAMAAMRIGAGLLQAAILKNLIGAATAGQDALSRLGAISHEASLRLGDISKTATEVALRTPHSFASIVQGIEVLYRAGLSLKEAEAAIDAIARLATISGRSLATEAEFISTILISFRETLGEGGAARAINMLTEASKLSRYWFGDLEEALSNSMATASALNQTLEQTLAILTALGQKGVPAAQAGTLISRTLSQMGSEKVINFFEESLAVYRELGLGEPPALFTPAGLGDMGEIMIAAAEAWEKAMSMVPEELLPEAQKIRLMTLSEIFGIRGIRMFLALSDYGLENYRKMRDTIAGINSELGASEEYMNRLSSSWFFSREFFRNASAAVRQMLGLPLVQFLNPVVRLLGEASVAVAKFGSNTKNAGSDIAKFITTMISLGGTLTVVAGGISLLMGVFRLWAGRFFDIGSKIRQQLVEAPGIATQIAGGRYSAEALLGMKPERVGMMYMFGNVLGPLGLAAKIVAIIAAGFLVWKYNLAGVRDRLMPIIENLKKITGIGQEKPGAPGSLGEQWGARLGRFFSAETRTGSFLTGLVSGFKRAVELFTYVLVAAYDILRPIVTGFSNVVRFLFDRLAAFAGDGDVRRGWERLGNLIGILTGLSIISMSINSIGKLLLGAFHLYKKIFGGKAFLDIFGGGPFFRVLGRWTKGLGDIIFAVFGKLYDWGVRSGLGGKIVDLFLNIGELLSTKIATAISRFNVTHIVTRYAGKFLTWLWASVFNLPTWKHLRTIFGISGIGIKALGEGIAFVARYVASHIGGKAFLDIFGGGQFFRVLGRWTKGLGNIIFTVFGKLYDWGVRNWLGGRIADLFLNIGKLLSAPMLKIAIAISRFNVAHVVTRYASKFLAWLWTSVFNLPSWQHLRTIFGVSGTGIKALGEGIAFVTKYVASHIGALLRPLARPMAAVISGFTWLARTIISTVIPALINFARSIYVQAIAPIVGAAGGLLKGLVVGGLSLVGAKGIAAALAATGPTGWALLAGAAILSGIGYGVYKLVTSLRGREPTADIPSSTTTFGATGAAVPLASAVGLTRPVGYVGPVAQEIRFSPTIVLKEGTPEEHARQILSVLEVQAPQYFRREIEDLTVASIEDRARRIPLDRVTG